MKYVIKWRSTVTGATGKGEPLVDSAVEAERVVNTMNAEYPVLHHWYEADLDGLQGKQDDTRR